MDLVQTVAPIEEPITLQVAKDFLRVIETDDDTEIQAMITSAREYAENYTNRQIKSATYELYLEEFSETIQLPKNPIQSITSIEYMDESGVYQTLDSASYYTYLDNEITTIFFEDMPDHKDHKRAIKITFVSGYSAVPESITAYIKILVSTLYENRELYIIGVSVDKLANPMALKMLDMYRVQPI